MLQYSASFERQLRRSTSASVTYIGSRGFDQFRSRDINAPLPPLFASRPDPTRGVVREIEFDLLGTINAGSFFNVGVSLALYSGRPYSITTGHDDFNTGVANARPVGVPRNSLEGPGYADLDLRLSRDLFFDRVKKGDGPAMTFGIDALNVLNRVNDVGYVGTLSSPFFGRATAAQPPRRLQLSVRTRF